MADHGTAPVPRRKTLSPVFIVSLGHGGTHWVAATFYILLPFIRRDLGLSFVEAGVFVSIFHLSSVFANFGSGLAVDMTGRRVVFQALALAIGGGALFMFGVVQGFWMICVMVGLIGGANNLWHPAGISYLSAEFPDNRGFVLAMHGFGASLGDSMAPLAAGALLAWLSWPMAAMVNAVPVLALAVVILVLLLPRDTPAPGQKRRGMGLGEYLGGLRSILGNRAVMGLALMSGFRTMALNGLLMFLPLYLAEGLGFGPLVMGSALMAMQVGGMISGPIAGTLSDRVGRRPVVLGGLTLTTVVIVGLTFIDSATPYVISVAILGFGLYAIRPVVHSWMMDLVPASLGGSATSLMFGTQALLSTLTPIIGGWVADTYGLVNVFYVIAGVIVIANTMAVMLPKSEPGRA